MEFDPQNKIIQLCLQGMAQEEKDRYNEAETIFIQAWNEASNNFEKFLASYYLARQQKDTGQRLKWLEKSLHHAKLVDDLSVKGAFHSLYMNIANCYEALNDWPSAEQYRVLAQSDGVALYDSGPFYHGTKAKMKIGEKLIAGSISNYKESLTMNHIYFTAVLNGAGLAAALAKGDGEEHVYIVEPIGQFENDPNVTDKKFPGNPTRSYRSTEPLLIIGEVKEWVRQTPEQILQWREKLKNNNGEIIN